MMLSILKHLHASGICIHTYVYSTSPRGILTSNEKISTLAAFSVLLSNTVLIRLVHISVVNLGNTLQVTLSQLCRGGHWGLR